MTTLALDGSTWRDKEDFYREFFASVSAPEWHGRNLDALRDSLIGGSIIGTYPPFNITVTGAGSWPNSLAAFMLDVERVFGEARSEGVDIRLVLAK